MKTPLFACLSLALAAAGCAGGRTRVPEEVMHQAQFVIDSDGSVRDRKAVRAALADVARELRFEDRVEESTLQDRFAVFVEPGEDLPVFMAARGFADSIVVDVSDSYRPAVPTKFASVRDQVRDRLIRRFGERMTEADHAKWIPLTHEFNPMYCRDFLSFEGNKTPLPHRSCDY